MSLYYRAEEYHPVFIGGKKKKIFSWIYLMYVVEWNMNIDILTAIYLYLFKNVIQVRNLTCTPCFYQVKIFSKKCTCLYLIQ